MADATPTERRIQEITARRLQVPPERVPLDQPLVDGVGLESFEVLEAVLEIEEAFSPASIANDAITASVTLRELAAYIDGQLPLA